LKLNLALPLQRGGCEGAFHSPEALAGTGALAERLGFNAVAESDHPAPPGRWLDEGGHHALDPFVCLSFVAAATSRLRLQTAVLILPYRNPFLTARAAASLDVLSKGRLELGVGAGYLKGEFHALGVDFERRNERTDEYIRALKVAWGADEFAFQGSGYQARDARIQPRPLQRPHPPLMIGGNSRRAIRRAAELGDGWYPFRTPPVIAAKSRTASMEGPQDLAPALDHLRAACDAIGRKAPPQIAVWDLDAPGVGCEPDLIRERIGRYAELGVGAVTLGAEGRNPAEWADNVERLAADVLTRL